MRAGSVMSRPGTAATVKTVHRGGSQTERAPRKPTTPKTTKAWESPPRKMIAADAMWQEGDGTPMLQSFKQMTA